MIQIGQVRGVLDDDLAHGGKLCLHILCRSQQIGKIIGADNDKHGNRQRVQLVRGRALGIGQAFAKLADSTIERKGSSKALIDTGFLINSITQKIMADKAFVAKHEFTKDADEVFVNSDSYIKNAKSLDPVFKRRMFNEPD